MAFEESFTGSIRASPWFQMTGENTRIVISGLPTGLALIKRLSFPWLCQPCLSLQKYWVIAVRMQGCLSKALSKVDYLLCLFKKVGFKNLVFYSVCYFLPACKANSLLFLSICISLGLKTRKKPLLPSSEKNRLILLKANRELERCGFEWPRALIHSAVTVWVLWDTVHCARTCRDPDLEPSTPIPSLRGFQA